MKRTATFLSLTNGQSQEDGLSAKSGKRSQAVSPRESVIRNLLNYSKALAVLKSNETGYISLVMN